MRQEQIQYLPLDKIECESELRDKVSDESLIGLARSEQENGFLSPPRVQRKGEKFVVVVGERRVRAAKLAKFTTIPVIIEDKELSKAEVLQRWLVENVQRVDLNPMEMARAIELHIEASGLPASHVAGKLGLSNGSITRARALLSLSEAIQAKVADRTIPPSSAYELSRIADPDKQAALAQEIANCQLTRDRISEALEQAGNEVAAKAPSDVKRATAVLGGGQSVTVTGTSLTLERFVEIVEGLLGKARKSRNRGENLGKFLKLLRSEARTVAAQP